MAFAPTNYIEKEGGEWIAAEGVDLSSTQYAAVMFSDGTVWDQVLNTWRGLIDREPFVPDKPVMVMTKPKHAGGRPTDYRPEYCDLVKRYCAGGLSLTAFAGEIEVARSTISDWMDVWPEFSLACKVAINKRAGFHENRMNSAESTGPMVQASRFSLVNCNLKDEPNDWCEKIQNETTVNKGAGWESVFTQIVNQSRTI